MLGDYAAVTGFDPAKPETDQGTDVQQAAEYRRTTGVIDAHGSRHRIAAYLALKPGNLQHLYQATYLFGAAGIGLQLPATALEQSQNRGKRGTSLPARRLTAATTCRWSVARQQRLHVISWGTDQVMSETFLKQYCDEAIAYVSLECLVNQKSPEGFSYADLISDLAALS